MKKIITKILVLLMILCTMPVGLLPQSVVKAEDNAATVHDVLQPNYNNKKGIQGTEYKYGNTADSNPESLNINHVLFNVDLVNVINTDGTGTPYVYEGKTYYFNYENYVKVYEWRARELKAEGKAITFVILMSWNTNQELQKFIHPNAREAGHYFYALNVVDADAKKTLEATFHYLADVFGNSDTFVQNWIIGNEVNMPSNYNYSGSGEKDYNVDICVKSFDLLYDALQDENPYAKAYISLTHAWNNNDEGRGISSKEFLDAFAMQESGKNWNLAFHAYPPIMEEHVWSKTSATYLNHNPGTSFVCGANLEVLTDYVKNEYGASHRIILSEQSFDSALGEDEQAAMIAYTYYAGAYNDMVDAIIFTCWADSNNPVYEGYKFGVVDESGKQKAAYNVFKYMNTSSATQYTDECKNLLGINNWSDNILYQAPAIDAVLTNSSLYLAEHTKEEILIGMTTAVSKPADLEYKWSVYDVTADKWTVVSDWMLNFEWLRWQPQTSGEYKIKGEVRVAGNTSSYATHTQDIIHNQYIKGKCQMPYQGNGGGYLIGVETYDNPNQSYSYELLVLDCTLLEQGKPAWIWTTGKCKVPENCFWAVWQPEYGYYWTLFRVYDAAGNMIDQACYGFANAY